MIGKEHVGGILHEKEIVLNLKEDINIIDIINKINDIPLDNTQLMPSKINLDGYVVFDKKVKKLMYLHRRTKNKRIKNKLNKRILEHIFSYDWR